MSMPSKDELIQQSVELFKKGNYRLTIHAEQERERDEITLKEIEECFGSGTMELIEDYPEDPRGHSFLLLGFTSRREAVHFVCAVHEEELVMITLYKPDPAKWKNWRERIR